MTNRPDDRPSRFRLAYMGDHRRVGVADHGFHHLIPEATSRWGPGISDRGEGNRAMMSDPSSRRAAACRVLALLGTLALVSAGREARATDLTVSNDLPTTTPPNPPYATVDVIQKSTNVVEITVTPTTNYYSSTGANFGVTNFTFDTNLTLAATDITVVTPSAGWSKVQNPSANFFGTFNWLLTSTRGAKKLVFDVNHTGATPSNFMIANSQGEMFAANIVDFTVNGSSVTSQWVSNAVTPHPLVKAGLSAAAVLAVVGAGAWFFVRQKKAKTPGAKGLAGA
jgi:hypothetical protein